MGLGPCQAVLQLPLIDLNFEAAFLACLDIEVRDSPHGIFGSWARWNRAPPDVQSSWETVAAAAAAVAAVTRTLWTLRSNNMRLEPPDMDIEIHLTRSGTARVGH